MAPELLVVLAVFVAVAALTAFAGFVFLERRSPERARLQQFSRRNTQAAVETGSLVEGATLPPWVGAILPKSPKEMGRIQRQLTRAGYHGRLAAVIYVFAELCYPWCSASPPCRTSGPGRAS